MKLRLIAAVTLGAGLLSAAEAPERLEAAADALKEVMGIPDKSIPQDLLDRAQCIVIVPGLKKGAFIVGAKYGKGFVSCRRRAAWAGPRLAPFAWRAGVSDSRSAARKPMCSCW